MIKTRLVALLSQAKKYIIQKKRTGFLFTFFPPFSLYVLFYLVKLAFFKARISAMRYSPACGRSQRCM